MSRKLAIPILYQVVDTDGLAICLIKSNCPISQMKKEWQEYNKIENYIDDDEIEGFQQWLQNKSFTAERVFTEEISL